jgi:hypothetical protein
MVRSCSLYVYAHSMAIILCLSVSKVALAQSSIGTNEAKADALVAKAPAMTYPAVARVAYVTGDVDLTVAVRQDGSVESAVVTGGPFLLRQAALDNALGSKFDCRGCNEPATQYSLVYTFQLVETDPCAVTEPAAGNNQRKAYPQVIRSPGHITVIDQAFITCDPAAETTKLRSIKCLFLWKCAYHRF